MVKKERISLINVITIFNLHVIQIEIIVFNLVVIIIVAILVMIKL